MANFERSTLVRAPFEAVWEFHTSVEGLVAITPDWLGLTVESVVGPDGDVRSDRLIEGGEVRLVMRPFGLGPPRSMSARVTHLNRSDDVAEIRDEMLDGPFPRWRHIHRFEAVPAGTRMTDRVAYALPLGPVRALSGLAWPAFAALFAYRHRATRRLLEAASER